MSYFEFNTDTQILLKKILDTSNIFKFTPSDAHDDSELQDKRHDDDHDDDDHDDDDDNDNDGRGGGQGMDSYNFNSHATPSNIRRSPDITRPPPPIGGRGALLLTPRVGSGRVGSDRLRTT